jgi:mRNA-degrading endonuclease RelE of RelBE toxin-antitoxin system
VSEGRALRFTRSAEKELRRLDPPIRSRVLAALDRLSADDRSLAVRRLTGSEHFRLRSRDALLEAVDERKELAALPDAAPF